MRMIYLTLGFFVLLGIGAACRTPPVLHSDCTPGITGTACPPAEQPDRG